MLTDAEAREIAASWQDRMTVPCCLAALASTGAIIAGDDSAHYLGGLSTVDRLEGMFAEGFARFDEYKCDDLGTAAENDAQVRALLAYVQHHGPRERQEGWWSR